MDLHAATGLIQTPLINATNPTRWADLGAGSGLFTTALARLLSAGSEIYAVDKNLVPEFPDFPSIIQLRRLQLDFISNDWPFRDLDGILLANSLHFVQEKAIFAEKLRMKLKTNGILILVEYDTDTAVGNWVPYPIGFQSLKLLFEGVGFASVEKLGEYPSIYGRTIYSAAVRA